MRLGQKFLGGFILVAVLPIIVYGALAYEMTVKGMMEVEDSRLKEHLVVTETLIRELEDNLLTNAMDYSIWTEMRDAVLNNDQAWLEENLTGWVPGLFKMHFVALTDVQGKVIARVGKFTGFNGQAIAHPIVARTLAKGASKGIIATPGGMMAVAASRVVDSNKKFPPVGVLIYGKMLNRETLFSLRKHPQINIALYTANGRVASTANKEEKDIYPDDRALAWAWSEVVGKGKIKVGHFFRSRSFAYTILRDIDGKVAALLEVSAPRGAILQSQRQIANLSILVLIMACFLGASLAGAISYPIIGPIRELAATAKAIANGDLSQEVIAVGSDEITELARSFNTMTAELRDKIASLNDSHDKLARLKEVAEELAVTDAMTGLYNYRYFDRHIKEELVRAQRYGHELSLIMLDIDYFKNFNDTYGHQRGDAALRTLSRLLQRVSRDVDIVTRYGGEEFAVILPETGKEGALMVAERIRQEAENMELLSLEGNGHSPLTISAGVATFPEDGETAYELTSVADQALYRAKAEGRNRVCSAQT